MKPLFQGIYTLFNAANPFKTAIGGRLYLNEIPQGSAYPYCAYYLITGSPDYYFNGRHEEFTIQFSLFDENSSSVTICNAFENLKTLFDDAAITVTGYTQYLFERNTSRLSRIEADNRWQYVVDYDVRMNT